MQIQQKGVGYDANFKPVSEDFDVGDPTMLIIMLRDKLYSDKLRVFLQEYISNGRDANREVGQPDHNLDITVPTKSEPIFKVRDFGPGLSPDRMKNVFVKFGASTKRESNAFIGGFGIGAKSAWAYTDSFVVKSYHNCMERHYLCHLGESPRGSMSLLHEATTTEPDGVEIQVQVKADDVQRAQGLIHFLTKLWPVSPRYVGGFTWDNAKIKNFDKMSFGIATGTGGNSALPGITVAVDGIPYKVECNYLKTLASGMSGGSSLVFNVKTGEIDIAANREQIEINDKYKAWLFKKVEETIIGINELHWAEAKKGLVSYLAFRRERGHDINLKRNRTVASENTIDYKALAAIETKLVEDTLSKLGSKETIEYMKELDLVTFNKVDTEKDQVASFPRLGDGFCWYFKKEKTFLLNGRLFPIELKDTEIFTRRRVETISLTTGKVRKSKELFQTPFPLWKGYLQKSEEKFKNGFDLGLFDPPYGRTTCEILYNNDGKTADELRKLTPRVSSNFTHIINATEIPQFMKELKVGELSRHFQESVRSYYPRTQRPTGSVRVVSYSERYNSNNTFNFGSFCEPTDFTDRKENYFKGMELVLYCYNSEPRNKWEAQLAPHVGRMSVNDLRFFQGNKKGIKYLQDTVKKVRFVHWQEWFSGQVVIEKGDGMQKMRNNPDTSLITQAEYEQFAYEWLKSECPKTLKLWADKMNEDSLTCKLYRDLVKEVKDADRRRGGYSGNSRISSYFRDNAKHLKNLDRSKIYQLRKQVLRRYPLIPLIEIEAEEHNSSAATLFNQFTGNPRAYVQQKAKRLGNAKDWLQRKK